MIQITRELVRVVAESYHGCNLTPAQIAPLWDDIIDAWNAQLAIPNFQFMIENYDFDEDSDDD